MAAAMALRAAALLLIASCLSLPTATVSQVVDNFSCPTGFVPLNDFYGATAPVCAADPCFGNPGPCGAGAQCAYKTTGVSGRTFLESMCTCYRPSVLSHIVYADFCYVPGTDRCNPNPCKNGGACEAVADFNGVMGAFRCTCPSNFQGTTCELPNPAPQPTPRTGTPAPTYTTSTRAPIPFGNLTFPPYVDQGLCGFGDAAYFPTRCYFNNDPQGRYVCCDGLGCNGFIADNLTPNCKDRGYYPPNFGVSGGAPSPPTTPTAPPPPMGDQGVCGMPGAEFFPTRCWFNNDPQGRYVCCDNQGCDGFNADNLTPHCKNFGYVPNMSGSNPSPAPVAPASGPQGVCGLGAASDFPNRCWYNNDPQGRYVCCDNNGCAGFYEPDNLFPRCKTNGFVPPSL